MYRTAEDYFTQEVKTVQKNLIWPQIFWQSPCCSLSSLHQRRPLGLSLLPWEVQMNNIWSERSQGRQNEEVFSVFIYHIMKTKIDNKTQRKTQYQSYVTGGLGFGTSTHWHKIRPLSLWLPANERFFKNVLLSPCNTNEKGKGMFLFLDDHVKDQHVPKDHMYLHLCGLKEVIQIILV